MRAGVRTRRSSNGSSLGPRRARLWLLFGRALARPRLERARAHRRRPACRPGGGPILRFGLQPNKEDEKQHTRLGSLRYINSAFANQLQMNWTFTNPLM